MMGAKPKKQTLAYFGDIKRTKGEEVIDLRKKPNFWGWLIIVFALIVGGWLFYGAVIKADIAYFYPTVALGTWQNVNKAVGQLDLTFEASNLEFNENNSAIFEGGGIKQIFLGNFQGQMNDYENKKISQAILKINWVIDDKTKRQTSTEDLIILESSPQILVTPPAENSATSSLEQSPNPTISNEETTAENPPTFIPSSISESISPLPSEEKTPVLTPTPTKTPIESSTPEISPTVSPQTFLQKTFRFFGSVFPKTFGLCSFWLWIILIILPRKLFIEKKF